MNLIKAKKQIKKIEKLAKQLNIKDYTLTLTLWQDDDSQLELTSNINDYKITIK